MTAESERMQILKMIEQGLITAQEGARLLGALGEGSPAKDAAGGGAKPRWFRVRVTDTRTGKRKVHVNIPLGLVNVGIRMGARFAPQIEDMDLSEILRQIEEEGMQGKIIDVEDEEDGEHVEIYVE
jgi:hypothetical protein